MPTAPRQLWQIGAGDAGRNYVDELIQYGVALMGSGDDGPFEDAAPHPEPTVRAFARYARVGDLVVLRTGRREVHAVGLIASDYLYLEQFDDVMGWDLQHARRVRWFRLPQTYAFTKDVFGPNPRRFSRCHDVEAQRYTEAFLGVPPIAWQQAALPTLHAATPLLAPDLLPPELNDIVGQALDLWRQYYDATRFGARPSEVETVARFVVPLLRALGWRPEHIAVEWRRIDVAVFDRLPREPQHLRLVVEAKQFGAGIEGALAQAQRYLRAAGVPRDVLVTDGPRYRFYASAQAHAERAYANLARLREPALQLFEAIRRPVEGSQEG